MKNEFVYPKFEMTIKDKNGGKIGDLRVKPSTIAWKRGTKGSSQFYTVSLGDFLTG